MLLALVLGCRGLALPRVAVEETSPDGRYVASVRNGHSIDPPNQSLWITDRETGDATRVLQLAEDQDWCDVIVWSEDSSTVVFLVQHAWIAVYDAATRRERGRQWLVERREYPTADEVKELRLAADGSLASYRTCRRGTTECSGHRAVSLAMTDGSPVGP